MDTGVLEGYVKGICRITWSDKETDARVKTIAEDAVVYLHHKLGIPGEPFPGIFENPGIERMLFENYCLYRWNNISEEFEMNYKREILTIRHRYEVEAVNEEATNDI